MGSNTDEPEDMVLSKISPTPKDGFCMILCERGLQSGRLCGDVKENRAARGWGRGWGVSVSWGQSLAR